MSRSIEKLLEEFNISAEDTRGMLQSILALISEGKVPKEIEIEKLDSSIVDLRQIYNSIFDLAISQVDKNDMPNIGASVTEYAEAINNSVAAQYRKQIEIIKNTLKEFVTVQAFANNYAIAFQPYKEQAEKLISSISGNDVIEIEKIENEVAGPSVFLEALKCEDIDSDEGMDLLDQAGEYYSRRVQNGLAAKKYYLPSREISDGECINEEDREEKNTVDTHLDSTDIIGFNEDEGTKAFKDSHEVLRETQIADDEALGDTLNSEETGVSCLFNVNDELKAPMQASSLRAFDVRAFKNDISGNFRSIRIDILIESRNNCVNASYISYRTGKEKDSIATQEEDLYNKGYLKKYYLDNNDEEPLYTLTSKGLRAFKSKEAIRYIGAKNREKAAAEITINDSTDYVLHLLYLKAKAHILQNNDIFMSKWGGKYGFVWNDEEETTLYVVANIDIDNQEDVLSYKEAVKSISDTIGQIYVLSYNAKTCASLMALTTVSLDVDEGCIGIITYSYVDNKWLTITEKQDNTKGDYCADEAVHNTELTELSEEESEQSSESEPQDDLDFPSSIYPEDEICNEESDAEENDKDDISKNVMDDNDNKIIVADFSEEQLNLEIQNLKENSNYDEIDQPIIEDDGDENLIDKLIRSSTMPDEDTFVELVENLIERKCTNEDELEDSIVSAILLAGTASMIPNYAKCESIYRKVALSTRTTWKPVPYSYEELSDVFVDITEDNESEAFASYLFAMLLPDHPYDYSLNTQIKEYIREYDSYFPNLGFAKELFNKLSGVQNIIPEGYTDSIVALLGDTKANDQFIANMKKRAGDLLVVSTPKIKLPQLPNMYSNCFGMKSDIYKGLEIVTQNNKNELEFIQILLQEYCDESDNGRYLIQAEKIDSKIAEEWERSCTKKHFALEYDARDTVRRSFNERLEVIAQWAEYTSKLLSSDYDIEYLRVLRKEIRKLALEVKEECKKSQLKNKNVLIWMLDQIEQQLSSKPTKKVFSRLLFTGIIPLSEEYLPIINEEYTSVKYYEPWRNVLRHITAPKQSFSQVVDSIRDIDKHSIMFDNLRQLEAIEQFGVLGKEDDGVNKKIEGSLTEAKKKASGASNAFMERLELDYTYSRLTELQKENLTILVEQNKERFFELREFGCWQQFLNALEQQAEDFNKINQDQLTNELNRRYSLLKDTESSEILDEAKRLLENEKNFAVAEEYLNRFDNGARSIRAGIATGYKDEDSYIEFISSQIFDDIYDACVRHTGAPLKGFGSQYIRKNVPQTWTNRLKSDSEELIKTWPSRKGQFTAEQIKSLIRGIGFIVQTVKRVSDKDLERFLVDVMPVERSLPDYTHPISMFGTQMETPFNVLVLFGKYTAQQLVDKMSATDYGTMPIVLIDYPLDQAIRRQICETFHKKSMQRPFIVIDQVLFIYLSLHQYTERLPVLLKCALPYTKYQPFVRDGGSVADEMFSGRKKELSEIVEPNGACVVYGGRQLGKTALLERAESLRHQPNEQMYAIYCSVINCDSEEKLIQTLLKAMRKKSIRFIKDCVTIEAFCDQIEELFDNGKIRRMLLLIDEADRFLASIADNRYKELQPLIDLKRRTKNSFKFVLAGLHNVCRAKNATIENGVFGQLGHPLCIKPLSSMDALQLLTRPMQYIGVRFEQNNHLATILTKTNYYPGILQFFGYTLTETLHSEYNAYFGASRNNPPFVLQDNQLGSVMNQADLNKSIRDKFLLTLELDERYFMLARCIGVLYYFNEGLSGTWSGASVSSILEVAQDYEIVCLISLDKSDVIRLLDEMVDMGVLLKPEEHTYRLRRRTFLDYIGRDFDTLDREIEVNNREVY